MIVIFFSSRLITCEADKTIKIYKEDDSASEESHPVNWKPDILKRRRYYLMDLSCLIVPLIRVAAD